MKYYIITYENGAFRHGEFESYSDAINYAESNNSGYDYTIEEYDSEDDYLIDI